MDSSHIVIIGLLVVILLVVVMARNRNNPSAAALRRQRAMAAMGRTAGLLGERRYRPRESDISSQMSTENFNWSHTADILEQQAQQKKELRDASFPLSTVFAKLGTMAETCAHDNTPQCVEFRKFANAMYHQ